MQTYKIIKNKNTIIIKDLKIYQNTNNTKLAKNSKLIKKKEKLQHNNNNKNQKNIKIILVD